MKITAIVGFGIVGVAIGFFAFIMLGRDILDPEHKWRGFFSPLLDYLCMSMFAFGILGGYVGYRITRSKDK